MDRGCVLVPAQKTRAQRAAKVEVQGRLHPSPIHDEPARLAGPEDVLEGSTSELRVDHRRDRPHPAEAELMHDRLEVIAREQGHRLTRLQAAVAPVVGDPVDGGTQLLPSDRSVQIAERWRIRPAPRMDPDRRPDASKPREGCLGQEGQDGPGGRKESGSIDGHGG